MTAPTVRVVIDPALCIGATACALVAPAQFSLNADARGIAPEGEVELDATLAEAVRGCPTGAIRLVSEVDDPA